MADERLTEKEVEAIIKRYGESQTGAGQTSVEDVAEALQVEPAVVEKLLHEVRTAESSKQLQERLATLEMENSQLRQRASQWEGDTHAMSGFESWSFYRPHRRRRMAAVMMGLLIAGLIASSSRNANIFSILIPVAIPLLIAVAVAFVIIRVLRKQ